MFPEFRNFDVLDDVFNDSFFKRKDKNLMKTDILEKDGNYILEMDLPGCKKDDIKIELKDGYLNINATYNNNVDESDEEKNYVHRERYYSNCKRSFYVGENVTDEDIDASFKDGILNVTFPKESLPNETEKKYISIKD
ncbi:MAG: Hsp20/alpha crystallin family protein [Bacilli bacterium]|nr:Hsp20/alpha crystallin family protein [Bacilli bacterium]